MKSILILRGLLRLRARNDIRILRIFLFLIFLFLLTTHNSQLTTKIHAQQFNDSIARTRDIIDKDADDGDIVSLTNEVNKLAKSKKAYDEKMFGVVVLHPIIVLRTQNGITPVISQGEAEINITTVNGPILPGDYITSSAIPGKGQKATDPTGALLGLAISSFSDKDGKAFTFEGKTYYAGKIKVNMGIQTPGIAKTRGGVFGMLETVVVALLSNVRQNAGSDRLIRYLIAGLVTTLTIIINFNHFGKNINHGIESVGRNPLARTSIQSMILLNVILIAAVSICGVILSLAIISF